MFARCGGDRNQAATTSRALADPSVPTYRFSPKPGVVVPRPPHGCGDVRPAGRMGDLAAGDDDLPLQGRGVLQRVRLRETSLAISRARPVDETRDRASLCAGRGRGVVRACASSARSEVGMPLPLRSGRRARNHESRQHECRERRPRKSGPAMPQSSRSSPGPIPQLCDPAPHQGHWCDPNRSPG